MSYINTATNKYPVSEQDIRSLYPDTAFPYPFSPPEGFSWVFPAPLPAYDRLRQLVLEAQPVKVKNNYEQRFTVQELSAEQVAANLEHEKTLLTNAFESAIQSFLDRTAISARYDSIATAVSYADEPAVEKFQSDGKAFRAWRSLVWGYAYEQLAKVLAGEREQPTIEAFLKELPVLVLRS